MQSMGVFSLNHDTTTSYRLGHTPFPLKFNHICTRIMAIRVYPYAHPQHLKVLKHFVYIQYGCGMQSMEVCSINHNTTTSYLRLVHTTVTFPKIHPHLHYYGIRVHPYAHPQHFKVLKHFVYIQYGCGMQSMKVCSLIHDTTTSYRLGHTPEFLKFTPTCTCNTAIRMHPHAHPQHLKVIKQLAYIQYGCGMHSMGGFQPQP